jgi:hypothetical protein
VFSIDRLLDVSAPVIDVRPAPRVRHSSPTSSSSSVAHDFNPLFDLVSSSTPPTHRQLNVSSLASEV